jgi:hypothetical protein
MRIKHKLDNPIENDLEINWFKMVWFTCFASIILSLGIVIGASLSNTFTSNNAFVAKYGTSLNVSSISSKVSNNSIKYGNLNFGITADLGTNSSNNGISYFQVSSLRVILSKVLVYSATSRRWISIPVNSNLVNLVSYENGNVFYLSHYSIPVGIYSNVKIYFKYVAAVLTNGTLVNLPLYNTNITTNSNFNILSNKNTYIAPVFNLNEMIGSFGGNYTFSPDISNFNVDY